MNSSDELPKDNGNDTQPATDGQQETVPQFSEQYFPAVSQQTVPQGSQLPKFQGAQQPNSPLYQQQQPVPQGFQIPNFQNAQQPFLQGHQSSALPLYQPKHLSHPHQKAAPLFYQSHLQQQPSILHSQQQPQILHSQQPARILAPTYQLKPLGYISPAQTNIPGPIMSNPVPFISQVPATLLDPRFQRVQFVIVSQNSWADSLRKKVEARMKYRDTLSDVDENNLKVSKVIPWYTVPADIEIAKQKAKQKPLYKGDNPSALLNTYSADKEFGKFSLAYEIYFKIISYFNRIWLIIFFQMLVVELAAALMCQHSQFTWSKSLTFNCVQNYEAPFRIIRLLIHAIGVYHILKYLKTTKENLVFDVEPELKYLAYSEKKFCLLIRGLTKTTSQDEIKEYFEEKFPQSEQNKITVKGMIRVREGVTIQKHISESKRHVLEKADPKMKAVKQQQQQDEEEAQSASSVLITNDLKEELLEVNRRNTMEIKQDIENAIRQDSDSDFTGCSIVCFETIQMRNYVKRTFKSRRSKCLGLFGSVFIPGLNGRRVEIQTLPEPGKLLWSNLDYSERSRSVKKAFAVILLLLVILAFCGINLGIVATTDILRQKPQLVIFTLQFVFGLVVRGVGKIAARVVRFKSLTAQEKFQFQYLLICDLFIFNFSPWAYVISNDFQEVHVYTKIFASMMFSNVLFYIYAAAKEYILTRSKRRQVNINGINTLTQREAEEFFAKPKLSFQRRIISLYLPLTLATTLYMIYPLLIPICFLVQYLFIRIDKHLIARYYGLPRENDAVLAFECIRVFDRMLLLLLSGFALFDARFALESWRGYLNLFTTGGALPPVLAVALFLLMIQAILFIPTIALMLSNACKKNILNKPGSQKDVFEDHYTKTGPFFETTYLSTYQYGTDKKYF